VAPGADHHDSPALGRNGGLTPARRGRIQHAIG
jgi:hypothetical protein